MCAFYGSLAFVCNIIYSTASRFVSNPHHTKYHTHTFHVGSCINVCDTHTHAANPNKFYRRLIVSLYHFQSIPLHALLNISGKIACSTLGLSEFSEIVRRRSYKKKSKAKQCSLASVALNAILLYFSAKNGHLLHTYVSPIHGIFFVIIRVSKASVNMCVTAETYNN